MLHKSLNRIGLLALLGLAPLPLLASSLQQDTGPMPPPKGPFFSSKPLLYFGEEPSVDETQTSDSQSVYIAPVDRVDGYPYYYAPPAASPYGMPFQQMAPMPQRWGAQRPYYPVYTAPEQQVFPNTRGYQEYPPFLNRGGR